MTDGLEMMDTFLAVFGLYLAGCGVATLMYGKIYGHGKDFGAKYTKESIREASPIVGVGTILAGLAMVVFKLGSVLPALSFLSEYAWTILIVMALAGIGIIALGYRKLIEK